MTQTLIVNNAAGKLAVIIQLVNGKLAFDLSKGVTFEMEDTDGLYFKQKDEQIYVSVEELSKLENQEIPEQESPNVSRETKIESNSEYGKNPLQEPDILESERAKNRLMLVSVSDPKRIRKRAEDVLAVIKETIKVGGRISDETIDQLVDLADLHYEILESRKAEVATPAAAETSNGDANEQRQ